MQLAPTHYSFHENYAMCLRFLKHREMADYCYKSVCDHLGIGFAYCEYGQLLFEMKRYNEAEKWFAKGINSVHYIKPSGEYKFSALHFSLELSLQQNRIIKKNIPLFWIYPLYGSK